MIKPKYLTQILFPILLLGMVLFLANIISGNNRKSGELTAKKYCSTCHLFPNPKNLTQKIWLEHVLPEMGHRMGIGDRNALLNRMSFNQFQLLCQLGIYPEKSIVPLNDWKRIVAYYAANAPTNSADSSFNTNYTNFIDPFEKILPAFNSNGEDQVTSVRFVPTKKEIWIGTYNGKLNHYDLSLQLKSTLNSPSPIIDTKGDLYPSFLAIGTMTPNEEKDGILYRQDSTKEKFLPVSTHLHRPVSFELMDINQDEKQDFVIAEFGFETGNLSWIDGAKGEKHIISHLPGARNMVPEDVNKDGKMDFYTLFAQANEQIVLFLNKGNGEFISKTILRFPAVYGSSFLEMADFNKDGLKDIILTNGDNADYSPEIKRFHGIRIYLNKGNSQFNFIQHIPLAGATKTLCRDFDLDGDMDLMSIAFFSPNLSFPSLLYLRNKGNGDFQHTNLNLKRGQWMTMEAEDMDMDGDTDILLGQFKFGKGQSYPNTYPFLLLKNKTLPKKS